MFRDLLLRYRQTLLLTLALALPVASMYYHGKERTETSVIERGLLTVTSPVVRASHDVFEAGRNLLRGYVLLTEVASRNRELEQENRILLGEALKSRAQSDELQRVKRLCEFKDARKEFTTVPARVVGREVAVALELRAREHEVREPLGRVRVHPLVRAARGPFQPG